MEIAASIPSVDAASISGHSQVDINELSYLISYE
jgi:hypothetical protein